MQELGRFPDLGTFDMDTVSAYGSPKSRPQSQDRREASHQSEGSSRQVSTRSEMVPFITQPKAKKTETADGDSGEAKDTGRGEPSVPGTSPNVQLGQSQESEIANLSDACSDDAPASGQGQMGASSAMIRGGESLEATVAPGAGTLRVLFFSW
jgi:hypothetical protein